MEITIKNFGPPCPPIKGHYSHLVALKNGLVFLSGQKAWDSDGNLLVGDVKEQTRLVLANIESILKSNGMEIANIVQVQCHLANVNDYENFNMVYSEYLGEHKPARTFLAGYDLRGGALVELNITAFKINE